jgi:hypothetical protein
MVKDHVDHLVHIGVNGIDVKNIILKPHQMKQRIIKIKCYSQRLELTKIKKLLKNDLKLTM